MTAAAPLDLETPLPAELAGREHGWFTRYRRYPVFSRAWMQGRLRSVGLVVLLSYLALVLPIVVLGREPGTPMPLGGLMQLALGMFVPLWLGPWLAWKVRSQGWPEAREWRTLVLAMLLTVLVMHAFHEWASEPLKQFMAEQAGQVDASGKRKRMVMSVGVSVTNPDGSPAVATPGTPITERDSGLIQASNIVSLSLLSLWIGGGAGLLAWRRERSGLAALAQERELAQAQAQRREAELRLSVLAAQVEPHFLFNTLAGVRSAIATDPTRASDMIDRLVDYLRAAIPRLRSDGEVQATLGAQLDIVRAYLALMAARMPRLQWDVRVPPELLGARFPPLMLISLAENAVKHGVERKRGPARVELVAERDAAGALAVSVLDDGPGFQPDGGGSGLGLVNIRERLAQLYPGTAALVLKARPEGGVAATLTVPLE